MGAQQTIEQTDGESTGVRRAMTSPVNWGVLGLLLRRPSYGYRLIDQFERYYGNVLSASGPSHVYAALNQLVGRGLIEEASTARATGSGTKRQRKVYYQATDKGVQAYHAHMLVVVEKECRRSLLFALQLAVLEHDPTTALEILDHHERAYLREARSRSSQRPSSSSSSELAESLLSEESRLVAEGKLPWVEFARAKFRAIEARS
jgi:DNA-binding PadR family transcriptional regulator